MNNQNGWGEWSKYVLKELERLNNTQQAIQKDVAKIREEIAILKVKSGIWGAVGGAIPLMVLLIMRLING